MYKQKKDKHQKLCGVKQLDIENTASTTNRHSNNTSEDDGKQIKLGDNPCKD